MKIPASYMRVVCLAALFLAVLTTGSLYAQDNMTGLKCVVLDPGHGGHDSGCLSLDRRYKEKDIVLSVALKLGKILEEEHPDVKVVYTRKKDVFIPLAERADIANRNKADLFISIHVNANTSPAPYGSETYTMGAHVSGKNFEVSKRENSVIKMEDDYSTRYEGFNPDSPESYIIFSLLQNAYSEQSIKFASYIQDEYRKGPVRGDRGVRQAGFLVLWRTTMPSVLTEIGFLTNGSDKAKLVTAEGQQTIARRLADAFTRYKEDYDSQFSQEPESESQPSKDSISTPSDSSKVSALEAEGVRFSIQFLASKKKLKASSPDFRGIKNAKYVYDSGFYKYYTGDYSTREEASSSLSSIKKKFKDAFIIAIKNGKIAGR